MSQIYLSSIIANCGADKILVNIKTDKKSQPPALGPIALGRESILQVGESLISMGLKIYPGEEWFPFIMKISDVTMYSIIENSS